MLRKRKKKKAGEEVMIWGVYVRFEILDMGPGKASLRE